MPCNGAQAPIHGGVPLTNFVVCTRKWAFSVYNLIGPVLPNLTSLSHLAGLLRSRSLDGWNCGILFCQTDSLELSSSIVLYKFSLISVEILTGGVVHVWILFPPQCISRNLPEQVRSISPFQLFDANIAKYSHDVKMTLGRGVGRLCKD